MRREHMAAAGAVMDKTANIYMQLIADVGKTGVWVCVCVSACVRSEEDKGNVELLEHSPPT